MDTIEAAKLLVMVGAITGREPSSAQAHGWAFALEDVPFEVAEEALRALVKAGEPGPITAPAIRRHAGPAMLRLARNVRSAKLRGLVPGDWPESTPLPPAAAARLRAEFDATNDLGELGAAAPAPTQKEIRP